MSFKIGVLKNFANFIGKHQCWSLGASTKDVSTLGKGERGQAKAGKCGQREREELAKCGRPLGKNYSYHICEIYSDHLALWLYIKFSFCLCSIGNVRNAM